MDLYKIKLILLMVLLHLLKFVLSVLVCFGVPILLISIAYTWYLYNTDPMENDWDKHVDRSIRYVQASLNGMILCLGTLGIHIYLLKTMDRYQEYIGNPGPSNVDAFYAQYGHLFPQIDARLKAILGKHISLIDQAEYERCEAVDTDKRDLEYFHQVSKARDELLEALYKNNIPVVYADNTQSYGYPVHRVTRSEKKLRYYTPAESGY